MPPPHLHYTANPLDRAAHLRSDPAWIAARLSDPATWFIAVWNDRSHVTAETSPRPAYLAGERASMALELAEEVIFLGLMHSRGDSRAIFALDLSPLSESEALDAVASGVFRDLRQVGPLMSQAEGALLAYARAIVHWHGRHPFCPRCGSRSEAQDAGFARICSSRACGATQFPRTDPAVIMLVHDGDARCVLGSHPRMPPGMHSTLAGFVEPGESLEEAVAREVREEVGLDLEPGSIHYFASQPWPFPASLMLGFHARAPYAPLTIDREELSTARWCHREEIVQSAEDERFRLPRRDSIARRLIQSWLDGGG